MGPPTFGSILPSSSPRSGKDVSGHGTPSTVTTVTSPGHTGQTFGFRPAYSVSSVTSNSSPYHEEVANDQSAIAFDTDPFTFSHASEIRAGLSPTATNFTPGQSKGRNLTSSGRISTALTAKSADDLNHGRFAHVSQAHNAPGAVGQIATGRGIVDALDQLSLGSAPVFKPDGHYRFSSIHEGVLTSDEVAQRAIKINGGPGPKSLDHLQVRFNTHTYSSCSGSDVRHQFGVEVLLVQFFDIRDAVRAYEDTRNGRWKVDYLNPRSLNFEMASSANVAGMCQKISNFRGQLKAKILFNPQNSLLTASFVIYLIKSKLRAHGDIKAMHSLQPCFAHVKEYCIEFYDTRSADGAYIALNNKDIGYELSMKLEHSREDIVDPAPYMDHFSGRYAEQPSITGRSTVPMNDPFYNAITTLPPLNGHGAHVFSASSAPSANHNQVDVDRIRDGLDVRTTIMLRNIPNRIDQAMLKSIVDETSFGQYDFMYLRIDFANNCNVGYAFINFEDPISIIDFAYARAGRRWNRFGSDKVAEISYATIQGRDCLVQKFRNSSVMLEHPTFRPKLYTTGEGPDAGCEEAFPGPDNHFKMRRSVENAETVGLFAPRHGQQYRDDQRRRRSQYDRGTTAAENEARYEGLYDPARSGSATRAHGAARFGGRGTCLPYY